ncbi:putative Ig domain-containing protein, partial [Klebsiella michiganensis]|uniref:putative Ig domain-containing protein n=1 Tax=Klebsiella michiganensis TaxID=1134687 RepID=UPI0013D56AEA
VLEGDTFTTALPSTNIPSPTFSFASSVPGWLTINPSSGAISGTSDDVTATVVIDARVRAANGAIAATANWTI